MSKEKHFKIYDGQEPIKLIEFLNDGTINFANDEVKMIFKAGVKHAQSKVNNSVLDDVSNCPNCGSTNRINVLCKDCGYDALDE